MVQPLRSVRGAGVLVVLIGAWSLALEAGGWVVITVKDMPDHVVAGSPFVLTYAVRQHGARLVGDLRGSVEARSADQAVTARAKALPAVGSYSATLLLPRPGIWLLAIDSGFGGELDSTRLVVTAVAPGSRPAALTEPDRGQRLFAAKGCVTCHTHSAVEGPSTSVGPALTGRRFDVGFLRTFLAHPPAPADAGELRMPDLQLRDSEIQSLIAFLNEPPAKSEPASALNR